MHSRWHHNTVSMIANVSTRAVIKEESNNSGKMSVMNTLRWGRPFKGQRECKISNLLSEQSAEHHLPPCWQRDVVRTAITTAATLMRLPSDGRGAPRTYSHSSYCYMEALSKRACEATLCTVTVSSIYNGQWWWRHTHRDVKGDWAVKSLLGAQRATHTVSNPRLLFNLQSPFKSFLTVYPADETNHMFKAYADLELIL